MPFSKNAHPVRIWSGEMQCRTALYFHYITVMANLSGIPGASTPAGDVDGIPVGIQFQAKPLEDEKIIQIMAAFEELN